jgi:hypothetical protein
MPTDRPSAPRTDADAAPSGPPDGAPGTRHASPRPPEPLSVFAFLGTAPEPPAELPDAPPELPDGPAELLAAPSPAAPLTITIANPTRPSLADYLRTLPSTTDDTWRPAEPPPLDGVDDITVNVETDGTDWRRGDRPVGLTVMTLEGQLKRFLPFRFAGGNLDEAVVKRWAQRELRGKHILNANTRFDVHMLRAWGVDLEEQGCTVSDVMHYAAHVDDRRKRFALDVLVKDYLHEDGPPRVDESRMTSYHAAEVAERAEYQVEAVARLRDELWPEMDAQHLQRVRQLEDDVIYPLCEMERNGAPIDMALLEQFSRECRQASDRLLLEIVDEVGFGFTPSPAGWKELFERLRLPPSEEGYAEEIITAIDHPLVRKGHLAAQYASLHSKTFSAYPKQIQNGVLYYDINQLRGDDGGTVSGRFSIGYIQQVPKHDGHHADFGEGDVDKCHGTCPLFPRRLFIAGSGDYLDADAMQIEQRLFADLANNPRINAEYVKDPLRSFHKITWEILKQAKPDQLYSDTKNFNFAFQYGAKMVKLAVMMKFITAKVGEEIRAAKRWDDPRLNRIKAIEAAYKKMIPEGNFLLDMMSHLAKPACDQYCKKGDVLHQKYQHQGFVATALGRRSRFPDSYKTYIGLNRRLQGDAADIMKMKIVELHRERKQTGFTLRMTVHDSVGGDATTPETKDRVMTILNRQSVALRIPILWDVKTGKNWAQSQ